MSPPPPPVYAESRPHILVAPLSDHTSFFHNDAVQGEIFVKGLGGASISRRVRELSAALLLVDRAPGLPDAVLLRSGPRTLWSTPGQSASASTSSTPSFPSVHQFSIPLQSLLSDNEPFISASGRRYNPGSLDLSAASKGTVEWQLRVGLILEGDMVLEEIKLEGTPSIREPVGTPSEVIAVLERGGVRTRLVASDRAPRLGSLLHVGLEMRALERKKTGVAGLSSQPDPSATLRGLRRVRVELYRLIKVRSPSSEASSSREVPVTEAQHLNLLYASGKSLRFPGIGNLPLRVLFTLPTAQTGAAADGTWGEISMTTPYHDVSFFVRATFGFGALGEAAPPDVQDWVLQQDIEIRPKTFGYPVQADPVEESDIGGTSSAVMTDEDLAKEAYRQKGLDIVGTGGTFREEEMDQPPEFEAGPSHASQAPGLPSFTESEAIAAVGQAPFPRATVSDGGSHGESEMRVGRPESLGGELASWVEYDGYETFSIAPPSLSASYGASGSMDPPQPDDDHPRAVNDIAARLGVQRENGEPLGELELMERLGLGDGTRVVDMHDDLPPGIDEPSLPALPSFNTSQLHPPHDRHMSRDSQPTAHDISPPSFAASEAAQAVGGTATSIPRRGTVSRHSPATATTDLSPHHDDVQHAQPHGQAPPEYFGAGGQAGGPPAYS